MVVVRGPSQVRVEGGWRRGSVCNSCEMGGGLFGRCVLTLSCRSSDCRAVVVPLQVLLIFVYISSQINRMSWLYQIWRTYGGLLRDCTTNQQFSVDKILFWILFGQAHTETRWQVTTFQSLFIVCDYEESFFVTRVIRSKTTSSMSIH